MSLWFGVILLAALLVVVAHEERVYRRNLRSRRASFEAYCDERAARAQLGYPQDSPRAHLSAVNEALPHAVGTGGSAHEQGFDGLKDTPD